MEGTKYRLIYSFCLISKRLIYFAFLVLLYSVLPIRGVHSRNKMYTTPSVSGLQLDLRCAQRNKIYCVHFVKKFAFRFFKPKGVYDI